MRYIIPQAKTSIALDRDFGGDAWPADPGVAVEQFHPRSSSHRPVTRVRCAYDATNLYVHFTVRDRYVRSVHTRPQDHVCRDSCVEFFVQPRTADGRYPAYFNFEVNCGGTVLLWCIDADGDLSAPLAERSRPVGDDWLGRMQIVTSMPGLVEPEITDPVDWQLAYAVPFDLFEASIGPVDRSAGAVWRGNFYKCGDQTSHPHWASWSPVDGALDFHKPAFFGEIVLGS